MQVVLLKDIKGLGNQWDVKDVSDGYARNILLKQGIAAPATSDMLLRAESMRRVAEKKVKLNLDTVAQLASALSGVRVNITSKANEQGELYAAISNEQIIKAISKAGGYKVSSKAIRLKTPIKHVGEHSVPILFSGGKKASVVVSVSGEGG